MDLERKAIQRIQLASEMSLKYYNEPLIVTESGGKDSLVNTELTIRAGVPFEIQHNLTTADTPETILFIKEKFRRLELKGIKCTINYPTYKGKRTSMWQLIALKKTPPTRLIRYCCSVLKEQGGAIDLLQQA